MIQMAESTFQHLFLSHRPTLVSVSCLILHLVAISLAFQLSTSLRFDFNVIGEVE